MTESNFTLGALSPESAELIGQLDPVLGSIVAARQTVQESTSALNFGSLLSDGASAGSSGEESIGDLDLGFYFDSPNNRAHEEIENDADDEEEEELVNLIRPESSASNTIDAISEQLEASLEDMIQTAQMHPRSLQVPVQFLQTFQLDCPEPVAFFSHQHQLFGLYASRLLCSRESSKSVGQGRKKKMIEQVVRRSTSYEREVRSRRMFVC